MKRVGSIILAVMTAAALITGCAAGTGNMEAQGETSGGQQADGETATDESEAETVPGIEAIDPEDSKGIMKNTVNSFNWDLFNYYDREENLFFSPYCLVSALVLTDLGAAGDTRSEIEKSLYIEDYNGLLGELKGYLEREEKESAYLRTANGLFIDGSLKTSPSYEKAFKETAVNDLHGEFRTVDFRNDTDSVKKEISSWVKDATGGMISDFESGATKDTVADILSAVYFYGEWQTKFQHDNTYTETFKGLKGDSDVEMMHMDRTYFRYTDDTRGIKALALPYEGGEYEMDILMMADPDAKGAPEIPDSETAEEVLSTLDNAGETEIYTLALPKFKLDLELEELKETLKALGMKSMFTEDADFSRLAEDVMISDINHRAAVEVDEEGSRAAAVTEVMATLTSIMEEDEPKTEFIVDRPFVFLIRDRQTGTILFTGRVNGI